MSSNESSTTWKERHEFIVSIRDTGLLKLPEPQIPGQGGYLPRRDAKRQYYVRGIWQLTFQAWSNGIDRSEAENRNLFLDLGIRPLQALSSEQLVNIEITNMRNETMEKMTGCSFIFRPQKTMDGAYTFQYHHGIPHKASELPDEIKVIVSTLEPQDINARNRQHVEEVDQRLTNYLQLFNDPLFSDIIFSFPQRDGREMKLYSSSKLLTGACTYFKLMFQSDGFAESTSTVASTSKVAMPNKESSKFEVDEDDSDAERDVVLQRSYVEANLVRSPDTFKHIRITHTCYSTYRACLYYLFSNVIKFGQIGSKGATESSIMETEISPPGDPITVSPKSVYRFAHAYDIPSLKKLALQNIGSQLTPSNILTELHSRFACTYDEVRNVYINYLVENWKRINRNSFAGESMDEQGVIAYPLFVEIMNRSASRYDNVKKLNNRTVTHDDSMNAPNAVIAKFPGSRNYFEDEDDLDEDEDFDEEIDYDDGYDDGYGGGFMF